MKERKVERKDLGVGGVIESRWKESERDGEGKKKDRGSAWRKEREREGWGRDGGELWTGAEIEREKGKKKKTSESCRCASAARWEERLHYMPVCARTHTHTLTCTQMGGSCTRVWEFTCWHIHTYESLETLRKWLVVKEKEKEKWMCLRVHSSTYTHTHTHTHTHTADIVIAVGDLFHFTSTVIECDLGVQPESWICSELRHRHLCSAWRPEW